MRENIHKPWKNLHAFFHYKRSGIGRYHISAYKHSLLDESPNNAAATLVYVDVSRRPGTPYNLFIQEMNELMDNLALMCAMQRNLEYTVEKKIRIPNFETAHFAHLLERRKP